MMNDFVQVGLWEEGGEEEWKVRVGDRLKEKLERARDGEMHHVLDHEEEHWMQMSGIQIHHEHYRSSHFQSQKMGRSSIDFNGVQVLNWEAVCL